MPAQLDVEITYLEMTQPPQPLLMPKCDGAEVARAVAPPLHFYRYLYNTVGAPWLWWERRVMGDHELGEILADPNVVVYVLYSEGAPAGYYELDSREGNGVQLAYFGLFEERIGRGLGRYLLSHAIATAWTGKPSRVWVHTCTLDHPRALPMYERSGFAPYRTERRKVPDPRPLTTV